MPPRIWPYLLALFVGILVLFLSARTTILDKPISFLQRGCAAKEKPGVGYVTVMTPCGKISLRNYAYARALKQGVPVRSETGEIVGYRFQAPLVKKPSPGTRRIPPAKRCRAPDYKGCY